MKSLIGKRFIEATGEASIRTKQAVLSTAQRANRYAKLKGFNDSLWAIHKGDEIAQRRHMRGLAAIALSHGYEDALSKGVYQPNFPELHAGKPFTFYDWEQLDPELSYEQEALVIIPDDNVFQFASRAVHRENNRRLTRTIGSVS